MKEYNFDLHKSLLNRQWHDREKKMDRNKSINRMKSLCIFNREYIYLFGLP